jgi:hypothetical protein
MRMTFCSMTQERLTPRTTPTVVTNLYLLLRTVLKYSKASTSQKLLGRNEIKLGRKLSSLVSSAGDCRDSTIHIRAQSMLFLCITFRTDYLRNRCDARRVRLFSAVYAMMRC